MQRRLDQLLATIVSRGMKGLVIWGDSTAEEDFLNGFVCTFVRVVRKGPAPDSFRPSKPPAAAQFVANVSRIPLSGVPLVHELCRQRDGACVGLIHVHTDKLHESQQDLNVAVRATGSTDEFRLFSLPLSLSRCPSLSLYLDPYLSGPIAFSPPPSPSPTLTHTPHSTWPNPPTPHPDRPPQLDAFAALGDFVHVFNEGLHIHAERTDDNRTHQLNVLKPMLSQLDSWFETHSSNSIGLWRETYPQVKYAYCRFMTMMSMYANRTR